MEQTRIESKNSKQPDHHAEPSLASCLCSFHGHCVCALYMLQGQPALRDWRSTTMIKQRKVMHETEAVGLSCVLCLF